MQEELLLGNLDACRDWGYAPEYVEAMRLMLQQPQPDDYVIATGETRSVRDCEQAAWEAFCAELERSRKEVEEIGRDKKSGQGMVRIDPALFRPAEAVDLVGDYSTARQKIGWSPKTAFKNLVRLRVEHELALVSKSG